LGHDTRQTRAGRPAGYAGAALLDV
jgi:hypothetical protein